MNSPRRGRRPARTQEEILAYVTPFARQRAIRQGLAPSIDDILSDTYRSGDGTPRASLYRAIAGQASELVNMSPTEQFLRTIGIVPAVIVDWEVYYPFLDKNGKVSIVSSTIDEFVKPLEQGSED